MNLDYLEQLFDEYADDIDYFSSGKDFKTLLSDFASGKLFLDYENILSLLLDTLGSGIRKTMPVMIQIIVICLLFSVLSGFSSMGADGTSKTAYLAQYLLVCALSCTAFMSVFSQGMELIDKLSQFSVKFFPTLFFLLISMGGITSAGILKPATAMVTSGICVVIKAYILPMLLIMCVLTVINSFTNVIKLNGFTDFVKSLVKWSLSVIFIVFLGFITLQGALSGTFDGISLRAAKYTVDKLVPIIGGMFGDTIDMLILSSSLIKNSVGVIGIILVFGMTFAPAVTVFTQHLLFKLAAAVIAPLSRSEISNLLSDMADAFKYLTAVIVSVGVMFIVCITVVIAAGNINVMMR